MPTLIAAGSSWLRLSGPVGRAAQPAGVHAVGGRGEHPGGRHVGGRVAELAAALVALDDLAAHGERVAEGLRGALDVTGGRQLRTYVEDQTCGPPSSAMPSAVKSCVAAQLGQRRDVAGRPSRRSGSWRRRRPPAACSASTRTSVDEPLRGPGRHLAGERHDEHGVDAGLAEQRGPGVQVGQRRRRVLGPQHRHRVRVEGDRHDGQAAQRPRDLAGPAHDVLVAEVHAVEVADRDDGPAEVAGHVVEGSPDLHGVCTTSWHPCGQTKTATGAATVAPLLVERQELPVGVEHRDRARPAEVERERAAEADVARLRVVEVVRREAAPGHIVDRDQPKSSASCVERACASSSANGPTAVRRSAVRWPPTPSAAPRSRASARM